MSVRNLNNRRTQNEEGQEQNDDVPLSCISISLDTHQKNLHSVVNIGVPSESVITDEEKRSLPPPSNIIVINP
jgi:hypothetical protein